MPISLQSSQHKGPTGERLGVLMMEDFLQLNLSKVVSTPPAGRRTAACDTEPGLCWEAGLLLSASGWWGQGAALRGAWAGGATVVLITPSYVLGAGPKTSDASFPLSPPGSPVGGSL